MLIPDGVWLDLPFETYVADPALGSTDLKGILLNAVYWHGANRNPVWMRILAEMQSKTQKLKAAAGQTYGSCLHTIALEPDQFDARYFVLPPMPDDMPETKADIAEALRAIGQTPPSMSRKFIEFEAMARMWGIKLAEDWALELREIAAGRMIIPEAWRASLDIVKRVLDRHSEASKFLQRGRAEVSVFYTDEHGDRYKVRFDYLRVRTLADVKSYENKAGGDAVATFCQAKDKWAYDFQAALYMWVRVNVLPDLVARRRVWKGQPVMNEGVLEAFPPTEADLAFLDEVAAFPNPTWWWIAISTLGVPEVDTISFPAGLMAWASANVQVEQAKATYREYREAFGADDNEMWIKDRGLIQLTDFNFSRRATDRGAVLHESMDAHRD